MEIENTERKDISKKEITTGIIAKEKSISIENKNKGKIGTSKKQSTWVPEDAKKSYHDQRLSQSKWSFWLSFWGSIIGFGVFIWSIYRGVNVGKPEWSGIVSATIIESVSALFYTFSNSANDKIIKFFAELTKDANRKDALEIVDKIQNEHIKDEVITKLSLHLAGIDEERICKYTREICEDNKKE